MSLIHSPFRFFLAIGGCFVLPLLAGCEKQDQVSTYTVPIHESIQTPEFRRQQTMRKPHDERILGAIVAHRPDLWFFKLQGLPDDVAAKENEFREFVSTVNFSAPSGVVGWKLPKDWVQQPGDNIRFATLEISKEPPLSVSVTRLPAGDSGLEKDLLANINRWREQLSLKRIELQDLPDQSETVSTADGKATIVNLVGLYVPGGPRQMAAPKPPPPQIHYEAPEGWTKIPPAMAAIASYEVAQNGQKVTISVSRLGGGLEANLNRWRDQVSLPHLEDSEIFKTLTKFPVGKHMGAFVELTGKDPKTGNPRTILGVMIPDEEEIVFVKLSGDPDLAVKERDHFEAFAKSVSF